jgi:catalase (peroxidase I)
LNLQEYVKKYANDQSAFFEDFKMAWMQLQELGCGQLQDIL